MAEIFPAVGGLPLAERAVLAAVEAAPGVVATRRGFLLVFPELEAVSGSGSDMHKTGRGELH